MDQSAMAEVLGCARTTVSNYERGFTTPRRAVILAWAMATGVDAEWLTTGNDETPPTGDGVSDGAPSQDRTDGLLITMPRVPRPVAHIRPAA